MIALTNTQKDAQRYTDAKLVLEFLQAGKSIQVVKAKLPKKVRKVMANTSPNQLVRSL